MITPSPPGGLSGMLSPGQTKPLGVSSTPGSFQVNTYFGIMQQKSGFFGVFCHFGFFFGFFYHFMATFGKGYQILDFTKSDIFGVFWPSQLLFATCCRYLAIVGESYQILDSRSSSMITPSPPGGLSGMLSPGQTKPLGVSSTPGSFQVNTYFGIFSDLQAILP